ncbi:MAG TPA: hypothetical protein DEQ39_19880 [Atlantibacter hermannii]|nr:hypothetical protein [Enterobacteriaceae bacterium]HCC13117.1 hypothetical protein [Atlantibacter hermannii]
MCLSPLIKSVCCWHQRQLNSKWCGILLQLLMLCKATPGIKDRFSAAFLQGRGLYTIPQGGEQCFTMKSAAHTLRRKQKR